MPKLVAALVAAVALLSASVAIAAVSSDVVDYAAPGGTYTGVRPTAVGLPSIGETGTVGAGDLPSSLRTYHDSGDYDKDLAAVAGAAKGYLETRLAQNTAPAPKPVRTCKTRYRRTHRRLHRKPLYRRVRTCRKTAQPAPPRLTGKPAIVLDIDETSLSNYSSMVASNFSGLGNAGAAVTGTGTAIAPTLDLYKYARANGVAVFFITGRPAEIEAMTKQNLESEGYDKGWDGLAEKPGDQGTKAFKSSTRAAIEKRGFDIVVNVGDQESDLDGGHADRSFKLPNPFYFIPD